MFGYLVEEEDEVPGIAEENLELRILLEENTSFSRDCIVCMQRQLVF